MDLGLGGDCRADAVSGTAASVWIENLLGNWVWRNPAGWYTSNDIGEFGNCPEGERDSGVDCWGCCRIWRECLDFNRSGGIFRGSRNCLDVFAEAAGGNVKGFGAESFCAGFFCWKKGLLSGGIIW